MLSLLVALCAQTQVDVANGATQPQVAVDREGRIYVAFLKGGNVQVAASLDRGVTFGEPVVALDAQGRARGGMQRGPRIGADAKGALVVTAPLLFEKGDLWLARSGDLGKTWSKAIRVNDAPGKAPESLHWLAVAPDGEAHVAWIDLRDAAPREQNLYYARVIGEKAQRNVRIGVNVCPCCAPGLAVDAKGNPFVAVRDGKGPDRAILLTASRDGGKSFGPVVSVNADKTGVDN